MFLLFVYMDFVTGGGWNDYRGQFATLALARDEAIDLLRAGSCSEAHVVDLDNAVMVLELEAFTDHKGFAIREDTLERILN